MAVLTEEISIVLRIDAIERKFPSGMRAFIDRKGAIQGFCADGELARVGFRDLNLLDATLADFVSWGLVHINGEGKAEDIALVDQLQGPMQPCDWLEWGVMSFGDRRIVACRLVGSKVEGIAVPPAWNYEISASANHVLIEPDELPPDAKKVGDAGSGLVAYRDPGSARTLYVRTPQ